MNYFDVLFAKKFGYCNDYYSQFFSKILSGEILSVMGVSPLSLPNALARPIKSLIQYGKCEQNGTPTSTVPVDIKCNNGTIAFGKQVQIVPEQIDSYIEEDTYKWIEYNGSSSICIPVIVGHKYTMRWTETASNKVGTFFCYGLSETDTPIGQVLSQAVRTSPQADQEVVFTSDRSFLVIQMSRNYITSNIENGYFVLIDNVVYVNGTPEVLTVSGKNIFDHDDFPWNETTTLTYIPLYVGDGDFTLSTPDFPVVGGVTNMFFLAGRVSSGANSSINGVWSGQSRTVTAINGYVTIANRTAGGQGLSQDNKPVDFRWQIEKGSFATDYEPYVEPQNASAVDLLSVGGYADTQDIIRGKVTRKVGVKVFDGTEEWSRTSARAMVAIDGSAFGSTHWTPFCSHYKSYTPASTLANMDDNSIKYNGNTNANVLFKDTTHNTSLDAWKAWVKSQYDNGTPIILVYPLADPEIETVTKQKLTTAAGTTIVSVTAEVSGVTLNAEYLGVS